MNMKIIVRFALRETLGVVLMGVALFWSAGEIGWLPAWALLGVIVSWIVATAVVTLRHSPELLAERLGPSKGAKRWDTIIMGIYGVMQLALLVIAGLDHRFGWTSGIGVMAQIGALVICFLGYALAVWATASNAYFSQIVRIQTERGHEVATGGPYRFVRHPAYTGTILTSVALPILLASWWAFAVGVLAALLMILRTILEDRTLQAELPGYLEYARRVRYRLVPGVW
jgi:protein-S-isoprenylcysteine O-methyltransferase Ste14